MKKGTGKNMCIWSVDNTLEEIKSLISLNYDTEFKTLKDSEFSDEDKKRKCSWTTFHNIIEKEVSDEISVSYIKGNAKIEVALLPESKWVDRGQLLSKNIRVTEVSSICMFVRNNSTEKVYCIVEGSKSTEGRIRSNLMRITDKDQIVNGVTWNGVNYKNVLNYTYESDFFYWLIYNKNRTINIDGYSFEIEDVKQFMSKEDRNEGSCQGDGNEVDREIPLMSLMSIDMKLILLKLKITLNNQSHYCFSFAYDGRVIIEDTQCIIQQTVGKYDTMDLNKVTLDIYFIILPKLYKQYREDIENWQTNKVTFRKKLCFDVIKQMLVENGIDFDELAAAVFIVND